jgi:hypothetical protein
MTEFPYQAEPEKLGFAHRARPEARIHDMSAVEKLLYVCKYLFAQRFEAPKDEIQHFDQQRALLKILRQQNAPKSAVQLGLLGDIMWIRDSWGSFLDHETHAYLESFHALVGNLETVISEQNPVEEFWPDCFRFNSDPRLVTSFRDRKSGKSLFSALSFANNHSLDFGDQGALDTLNFLKKEGIPQSGVHRDPKERLWVDFERGGIRFGFYAATFGMNDKNLETNTKLKINFLPGLLPEYPGNEPDLTEIRRILAEMEQAKIDVKLVSLHWGHEFEFYPSPKAMLFSRAVVEAGADVILGSHPHVPQPDEVLLVNGYGKELPAPKSSRIKDPSGRPRKAYVVYCSGNLSTAMYGFYSRLAPVKGLSFYRTEQGIDWCAPSIRFFYNARRSAKGKRKLLPLEREFPEPKESIRKKMAFLEQHLGLS